MRARSSAGLVGHGFVDVLAGAAGVEFEDAAGFEATEADLGGEGEAVEEGDAAVGPVLHANAPAEGGDGGGGGVGGGGGRRGGGGSEVGEGGGGEPGGEEEGGSALEEGAAIEGGGGSGGHVNQWAGVSRMRRIENPVRLWWWLSPKLENQVCRLVCQPWSPPSWGVVLHQ
jgi:hypothetical protein